MGKRQIELFATRADLETIVSDVKSQRDIQFVPVGMSESDAVIVLESPTCAATTATAFLALDRGQPVRTRSAPQKSGSIRFVVDQIENPGSVVVRHGGLVDKTILLAGQIGTVSSDTRSIHLFAAFSKAIRRRFVKIKSYWIGPEAERLLDSGVRLTPHPGSPVEYDLRR